MPKLRPHILGHAPYLRLLCDLIVRESRRYQVKIRLRNESDLTPIQASEYIFVRDNNFFLSNSLCFSFLKCTINKSKANKQKGLM